MIYDLHTGIRNAGQVVGYSYTDAAGFLKSRNLSTRILSREMHDPVNVICNPREIREEKPPSCSIRHLYNAVLPLGPRT